jgi:hypothetical protein
VTTFQKFIAEKQQAMVNFAHSGFDRMISSEEYFNETMRGYKSNHMSKWDICGHATISLCL